MLIDKLNPREYILIKNARTHNLKGIDVAIPRYKLVVITGLSGSGKSSLAFDTLFAEGQRRYVESLSSYARQFLGKLDKPKVDYIKGISPAIAIEQKVSIGNSRSTVGTATEIYDYIKLLFARIGKTYSPISGEPVQKDTVSTVSDYIFSFPEGKKMILTAPVALQNGSLSGKLQLFAGQGYSRILSKGKIWRIEEVNPGDLKHDSVELVIQRIVTGKKDDEDYRHRIADAVELAFHEGHGLCKVHDLESKTAKEFSRKFEKDGMEFVEPSEHLFTFNNPYGACPECNGYGKTIGIDPARVIPNTALSLYENCIAPWQTPAYDSYKKALFLHAGKYGISIHKPWFELSGEQQAMVWNGTPDFEGIRDFFNKLEEKNYKIQNRIILSRYRGKTLCPSCRGKRLRKEAGYVKVGGMSIFDLVDMPVVELKTFFEEFVPGRTEEKIAGRLLTEIKNRLDFLLDVGLGYLELNRNMNTLSGGETQRINLATSLGSNLTGALYILDEPSIGLHPRDNRRLISVLKKLRDLGNTVVVVEHDEEIMRQADYIIDLGPGAGNRGGQITAEGTPEQVSKEDSYTGKYLSGKLRIPVPTLRRSSKDFIRVEGAREHNLKNIEVHFPLHCLTVVTGVSGSGKSTLVNDILYPAVQKATGGYGKPAGQFSNLSGALSQIARVEFVDQNPIGRSSRSNPVTYIKAYDYIRELFAKQKLSRLRGYTPGFFSFNVDGGRCDTCKGEGETTVEMQFMADIHLTCEECGGKRFKKEILEVRFEGKNIHEILEMTVDEAIEFFDLHKQEKISKALRPLQEVGLGYIHLGQSSSTLSGGEAQRVKLAFFLTKAHHTDKVLFLFDEPTTGLHWHDIKKLLSAINALIENGHTVIVIEHHTDFIKAADYIIDLGPEGGKEGGYLLYQGTPEGLTAIKKSYTGTYIRQKL